MSCYVIVGCGAARNSAAETIRKRDPLRGDSPGKPAQGGGILLGDLRGEKEIQAAIEGRKDIPLVKKKMEEEGFDLSKIK